MAARFFCLFERAKVLSLRAIGAYLRQPRMKILGCSPSKEKAAGATAFEELAWHPAG